MDLLEPAERSIEKKPNNNDSSSSRCPGVFSGSSGCFQKYWYPKMDGL